MTVNRTRNLGYQTGIVELRFFNNLLGAAADDVSGVRLVKMLERFFQ